MSDDRDLYPTKLEAEIFITAVKRPLVTAVLMAAPFGFLSFAFAVLGIHPFNYLIVQSSMEPPFSDVVHFFAPLIGFTALFYALLTRPL